MRKKKAIGIYAIVAIMLISMSVGTAMAAKTDVKFATTGLPNPVSITVNWNGINNGGNPISGPTTFNSPGPSNAITTRSGTTFTYSFPASVSKSGIVYNLVSSSPTSPFTTTGGSQTVTAIYAADTTPPDTVIDSNLPSLTNSDSATFTFHSTESGSTFQCKLDADAYSSCTSGKSYSSLLQGSHTFSVKATDASGNTDPTPASFTWNIDTTAPVITRLGDNPVTVDVGDTYTDAGATALDNVDGDITASIITVNPVNTAVVGTYTVTYDVSDVAGNPATQVTRTVYVVNLPPPVPELSTSILTVTGLIGLFGLVRLRRRN